MTRTIRQIQRRGGYTLFLICWGLLTLTVTWAEEAAPSPEKSSGSGDLFDLNLDELLKLEVKGAAGLTKTDSRRVPVTLTEIDANTIEQSGSKDLNHLLEIYVPNAQFIDHHHHQMHMGLRGIISDREDKYLLQVNGRTMNNRMVLGADNERGIPLLGDLRSVSVVRGPASATHGAGAMAGAVSLETYNGLTFEGSDVKVRQGTIDQYSTMETRFGKKLDDKTGMFLYYGIADQPGASPDNAPYYIGRSYPATNGLPANTAGEPYEGPMDRFGAAGFDQLRHKLHASLVTGPMEFWVRFVQDGYTHPPQREIYRNTKPDTLSTEEWTLGRTFLNRQFTATARYKKELSEHWGLELMQSYDVWEFRDRRASTFLNNPERHGRENEAFSRAIATWSPTDRQSLALGMDYSHEWYFDPAQSDALDRAPAITDRDWQTDTVSFLGEYQWRITSQWTAFLSARTDKHTYSDWLFSPRGTLVYTPTERDTFKAMAGESVRRGCDEELYAQDLRSGTTPQAESLRTYELSYERTLDSHWQIGGNVFYSNYDAIGWTGTQSTALGTFQMLGGELTASYTHAGTRLNASQGVVKLLDSEVPGLAPHLGGSWQSITAQPYGYGDDLAEWSPFITKVALLHDLGRHWTMSSSLVWYWGFPGAKDMAEYNLEQVYPSRYIAPTPLTDPNYTEPFGANVYWNLGMEYRPSDRWTLRLDGYNLLSLVSDTLSKRNYYSRLSEFSVQPATATLSLRYRF